MSWFSNALRHNVPIHAFGRVNRAFERVAGAVLGWQQRAAERRHLAALDDRMLKDMGISRADVNRESTKPFWAA